LLSLLLQGCAEAPPTPTEQLPTIEESQIIAENHIKDSFQYREYNGRNLRHISTDIMRCPSCWTFHYEFDVDAEGLPEGVYGYQAKIPVIEGKVTNPIFKESVKD
jgi:hypothetical protein